MVVADTFNTALARNGLITEIDTIFNRVNLDVMSELEDTSQRIQEHIKAITLTDDLQDALLTPFNHLDTGFKKRPIGPKVKPPSVAVVIQKMVQSNAAGVAFSVHPVTEDKDHIVIEGVRGLEEAVVSGQRVMRDSHHVMDQTRICSVQVHEYAFVHPGGQSPREPGAMRPDLCGA